MSQRKSFEHKSPAPQSPFLGASECHPIQIESPGSPMDGAYMMMCDGHSRQRFLDELFKDLQDAQPAKKVGAHHGDRKL